MKRSYISATVRLSVSILCSVGIHNASASDHSVSNRAPLQSQAYARLPLGSVRAESWLKHQLELQRDGLTGHAEELYDDIGKSDWISTEKRGGQSAWERGPYYAKGLIALAYVLDDQSLKDKARKWIDRVLESQRENGDFGPKERNWWANMIVIHYMRDYYEATGDERIHPFLTKYFEFQLQQLPQHTLVGDSKWAKARGGDNLEIVLWLYNIQGGEKLLELARILVEQSNDWQEYYADGTGSRDGYPVHIVNLMQGMKTPPLKFLVSGDAAHRQGYQSTTDPDGWLMKQCGRVDGMFSGTEPLTDRSSTQGTELCAIVEGILSKSVAIKVLGDASIGDDLERIAYNALPASLTYDLKALRYYILPNQPKCSNENLGFKHNGTKESAIVPGPHSGYGCCRSDFHFGWPKFVHNMWMATGDNGLALATYGPNSVTAKVGSEARQVTFEQATDYPFRDQVILTVKAENPVEFPLVLRIPGWCESPQVQVNGKRQKDVVAGTFYRIERRWKDGDVVKLRFPMVSKLSHWVNDSVAVTRGPLAFSLMIEEEWKTLKTYDLLDGMFTERQIMPAGPWNYALILKNQEKPDIEVVVAETMPAQPFRAADAPVRLKLKAVRTDIDGWGSFRKDFPARAVEPPVSPVKVSGAVEEITLIPYGSTEIRITQFPWGTPENL